MPFSRVMWEQQVRRSSRPTFSSPAAAQEELEAGGSRSPSEDAYIARRGGLIQFAHSSCGWSFFRFHYLLKVTSILYVSVSIILLCVWSPADCKKTRPTHAFF
ncbi:hypothetical protein GQ55_1G308300 [Panicum hallii var. hallii]|uniref:Uncharacterized protein n=1 Tax=Panicum hallii var. hallii TaxID=1504633 RepID=A0A2T7F9A4_9POAL|nr:hypothetical protein GQ55_1G308300 [Panicum hallii var. hallii]